MVAAKVLARRVMLVAGFIGFFVVASQVAFRIAEMCYSMGSLVRR